MTGSIIVTILAVVTLFTRPSWQQTKDPLKDFCRRFSHQTAVIDNRLFIDGGYINFNPLDQNPANYTNVNLLYADLNVDNQGMPQNYANLSKPATVPSVAGGTLWPDTINKKLYLYGGEFQSPPQAFSVWSYDTLYNNWSFISPDVSQSGIQRASYGASAVAQERGLGFWYGGWLSNATVPTWGAEPFALSNLLQYDFVKNVWSNSTGPDNVGRAEGLLVQIPASDGGMLVYLGGIQTPYGNSTWVGQPMDKIFIYDIAGGKWYAEKATGTVPDMRRRFCGGATWSNDQSSYNIYLYGGASMPPFTVGFDDIYILSLPSFTWTKWYPDQPGSAFPHHSLTCNVINRNQMIVMGGTFPNSSTCDTPAVYGFHNMDLGKQNSDNAKWALFSNNKTGYKVPNEIYGEIGGDGNGGATKKAPAGGFQNNDLSVLMTRQYKVVSTRTATRAIPTGTGKSSSSTSSGTGAVIGGAVAGGVVAIILLSVGVFCCLKRKKKTKVQQDAVQETKDPQQQSSPYQHHPTQHYSPHPYIAPVQLPTGHEQPYQAPAPVELDGIHTTTVPAYGQQREKSPLYSYSEVDSAHSPPAQAPQTYFSPGESPAPAYQAPQGYSHAPPPPQQYFGTPSPPGPFAPSPESNHAHSQFPPPSTHPQQFASPTTIPSPGSHGFTPSPVSQGHAPPSVHQQGFY